MLLMREILALIAFASAIVFGIGGLVGLFRFSDPFSRMQAGSLCGTTAVFSLFLGVLILAPSVAMAARILLILFFFLLSAPTGSYIVARFTWNAGVLQGKPSRERIAQKQQRGDPE